MGPLLKKVVVCMECKVRYFLNYYMQLPLTYILILFIICSHECHANAPSFSRVREDAKGKETEVTNKQTKEVVANVYDYFKEINRYKQIQGSLKRTSDATGISHTSIKRLQQENVDIVGAAFSTLTKRYRTTVAL